MSGACMAHSYGMEEIHLSAVLQINVELVVTSSGIPLHVLCIIDFVDTYLNGPHYSLLVSSGSLRLQFLDNWFTFKNLTRKF